MSEIQVPQDWTFLLLRAGASHVLRLIYAYCITLSLLHSALRLIYAHCITLCLLHSVLRLLCAALNLCSLHFCRTMECAMCCAMQCALCCAYSVLTALLYAHSITAGRWRSARRGVPMMCTLLRRVAIKSGCRQRLTNFGAPS